MSQSERKLLDTRGRFALAVVDGRARNQLSWQQGRIVLSNRRLIVAGSDGKRSIGLKSISKLGGRADVNQEIASVPEYVSIHVDEDVFLIETSDSVELEFQLYQVLLNGSTVSVKHPAIEGGVVQDVEWVDGRLKLEDASVVIALASGKLVDVTLDDVATVDIDRREVNGNPAAVVNLDHTEDGTNVVTAVSGPIRQVRLFGSFVRSRTSKNDVSLELTTRDREVLMALYSGVSPFEIPDFVGLDPDTVEEIYDQLIEASVLNEVRVRREVELTPRGRNLASEAMSEQ